MAIQRKTGSNCTRYLSLRHCMICAICVLSTSLVICALYGSYIDEMFQTRKTTSLLARDFVQKNILSMRNYILDGKNLSNGIERSIHLDKIHEPFGSLPTDSVRTRKRFSQNFSLQRVNGEQRTSETFSDKLYVRRGDSILNNRTSSVTVSDKFNRNMFASHGKFTKTVHLPYMITRFEYPDVTVNPLQYNFVIKNENVCKSQKVDLLIYVYTSLSHANYRTAIRETWGRPEVMASLNFSLVFMLGRTDNNDFMKYIERESFKYGDIIQDDYIDSYQNLSLKGLSALKWITYHCPNVPFALKIDDDIIVNVYKLRRYITDAGHLFIKKKAVLGSLNTAIYVERVVDNKLYLSRERFPADIFPAYCAGAAYLMTSHAAKAIYRASFGERYLHIEDVFITGILAKKAGVLRAAITIHGTYEFRSTILTVCATNNEIPKEVLFAMVGEPFHLYSLWRCVKHQEKILY